MREKPGKQKRSIRPTHLLPTSLYSSGQPLIGLMQKTIQQLPPNFQRSFSILQNRPVPLSSPRLGSFGAIELHETGIAPKGVELAESTEKARFFPLFHLEI
jgi:hypothetical protein